METDKFPALDPDALPPCPKARPYSWHRLDTIVRLMEMGKRAAGDSSFFFPDDGPHDE